MIIIAGQSGTYRYLRSRVTHLLTHSGLRPALASWPAAAAPDSGDLSGTDSLFVIRIGGPLMKRSKVAHHELVMPFKVDLDPAHGPNRAQNRCRDVRPNRIVEIYDYPVMKPCTHAFPPNLVGAAPWPDMQAPKRSKGRMRGRFLPRIRSKRSQCRYIRPRGNEETARRVALCVPQGVAACRAGRTCMHLLCPAAYPVHQVGASPLEMIIISRRSSSQVRAAPIGICAAVSHAYSRIGVCDVSLPPTANERSVVPDGPCITVRCKPLRCFQRQLARPRLRSAWASRPGLVLADVCGSRARAADKAFRAAVPTCSRT